MAVCNLFSERSRFESVVNAYSAALAAARKRDVAALAAGRARDAAHVPGPRLLDLTLSNPTQCGFVDLLAGAGAIVAWSALRDYLPDPQGLYETREAIARYYSTHHGVTIASGALTLASGTSEAYRLLFELLCDPGDELLVSSPGYPLIDVLAKMSGVEVTHYALRYGTHWQIDLPGLEQKISSRTRAIVLISPNNPTGHVLSEAELAQIATLCAKHDLALIIDEVFVDYAKSRTHHPGLLATTQNVLTFLLNGLSKSAGLPQIKLSWILACGPTERVAEACRRIEFLADSLLSVSTFAQLVAPSVLAQVKTFHAQVRERIRRNLAALAATLPASQFEVLPSDGGWYQVVRVPECLGGEEGAIACIQKASVVVLPGYFFDFDEEHCIVISLITPEAEFQEGIARMVRFAAGEDIA